MKDFTNIIDTPLSSANEDKLDTRKYVQGLAQYLRQSSMPTTVAIQGQWGAGKTSFMNQLRSILCGDKDGNVPQYFGVWINMWEYSMMQTPEQTLISVIKGMIKECSKILASLNAPSAVMQEVKEKAWDFFKKAGSVVVSTAVKAGANAVGLDGDAAAAAFSDADFNETNPQEFRDAFAKAVEKCLNSQHEGQPRRRGFMFFIDDLDRINPENAVQILELLKNMFEVSNCIFVLAIDYDVVVKGLKTKFGSTGSDDDRAFRSFFDKIIQMPFSMPIGAYDITSFLEDSLKNIGYFSADELHKEIKLKREGEEETSSDTIISVVDEMTRLSTGTNPRSIKRLINTLSLIKIISNLQSQEETGEEPLNEYDYLMNYGLVCLQIAYPQIYDRIIEEPNYIAWDKDTARQFRLPRLTDEKKEALDSATEFNEDWEKVVYRICMTSSYLLTSALNISSLLNLIRSLYPEYQFESKINRMLGMTSVTSVTSVVKSENKTSRGSLIVDSIHDLNLDGMTTEQRDRLCNFMNSLGSNIITKFIHANIYHYVDFRLANSKKAFIQVFGRKYGYNIDFYAPNKDVFRKEAKYPEIAALIKEFGYKITGAPYVSIYVKDLEKEGNAFKFIKALYKVWDESV